MKKLIVFFLTAMMIASMGIVSSFAMHVARDGVTAYDENDRKKDGVALSQIGACPDYTDIGDISDKELTAFLISGWYAYEVPIQEFGYRIGDEEPVLGSPKFYGTDKDLIDSMAANLEPPCAESVRFHIVVPVYVGTEIEVVPVAVDEDGYVHDMPWTICYTSTYGVTPEPTAEPTPTKESTPTPDITPTPTAVSTPEAIDAPTAAPEEGGCGSVIGGGFAVLAVMSAAAAVLRKRGNR